MYCVTIFSNTIILMYMKITDNANVFALHIECYFNMLTELSNVKVLSYSDINIVCIQYVNCKLNF